MQCTAFMCRLYSVLRYESVIHEFDPWFNFRTTRVLAAQGFYNFLNWFDEYSWYPLGRIVGGTVFPGLMLTAGFVHRVLHLLNITVDIRNVCVLLAPWFASNTAIASYFFAKEAKGPGAGLLAAAFIAIVPGKLDLLLLVLIYSLQLIFHAVLQDHMTTKELQYLR